MTDDAGKTVTVLPDLPSVAHYLLTYTTAHAVLCQRCQYRHIWHGTKERPLRGATTDLLLNLLRDRRDAMQRGNACREDLQRWHPVTGRDGLARFDPTTTSRAEDKQQ